MSRGTRLPGCCAFGGNIAVSIRPGSETRAITVSALTLRRPRCWGHVYHRAIAVQERAR